MSKDSFSPQGGKDFKWLVIGGIFIILFTSLSVVFISIYSKALSKGFIAGLFGMELIIVLHIIDLLFRYPPRIQDHPIRHYLIDLFIKIAAGMIVAFITYKLGFA